MQVLFRASGYNRITHIIHGTSPYISLISMGFPVGKIYRSSHGLRMDFHVSPNPWLPGSGEENDQCLLS